ncbi:cationic amino acid transporter 3-like isoform X2 [Dreissena polymorpha]|uniref:cationic amino acid transporter 3-like isoform X2 n=1 Tax=Dreissena polymorpha TaxID=45954 RepID=UPI0022643BD4|nr:cationic amino acid transporter 3-like isoform X2 [Dreissena polymorpha]
MKLKVMGMPSVCSNLLRRKTVVTSSLHHTNLTRSLGLLGAIAIGIGSSLGLGAFVITSYAIQNVAGPSFVISVIIAGVANLLAGLAYAENSARLPRAGSAYFYTYVALGELCGFVVGWHLLLENVIAAAIAAKAWSQYVNFITNGTISSAFQLHQMTIASRENSIFVETPDIIALLIALVVSCLSFARAKYTVIVSMVLVLLNGLIIMCFVCIGYLHVDHNNWTGGLGFFAHGFSGVLYGAALLMPVFSGNETITVAVEETREPSKTTPTAIMYSICVCSIVYFCIATSATLALPMSPSMHITDLPDMLDALHIYGASSVIAVGGLIGLIASLLGQICGIPRLLYAMSVDKLMFDRFSHITPKGGLKPYGAIIAGMFVSVISVFVKLEALLQIVSIGTLIAYTMVSISVICFRYQPDTDCLGLYIEYRDIDEDSVLNHMNLFHTSQLNGSSQSSTNSSARDFYYELQNQTEKCRDSQDNEHTHSRQGLQSIRGLPSKISNTANGSVTSLLTTPLSDLSTPSRTSWLRTAIGLIVFILISILLCTLMKISELFKSVNSWLILLILFIVLVALVVSIAVVASQAQHRTKLHFRLPYVPCIPMMSIFINIFLIAALPSEAWIRFAVWTVLGLFMYCAYGYRSSQMSRCTDNAVILSEMAD